jgi:hypothetical protein
MYRRVQKRYNWTGWYSRLQGGAVGAVGAVGRGLVAGAIGTIALTLAERAEMAVTGRKASTFPGQVGVKLSGRDPASSPELVEKLNPMVHWAHGIALGPVRGLLDRAGMGPAAATLVFVPMVWGGDAALYRALGLAPEPWRWTPGELATDLFGKSVLAVSTSVAYSLLDR